MELPKKYNPTEAEPKWQLYWEQNKIYKFDKDSKAEIFSVDTPPPTVSGKMHIGHASMYSQQDFIVRYQRMRGKNIFCPFGTDDNGLATKLLVEKLKKVNASKMGRKEFTKLCLDTLNKELRPQYIADWKRIGMSCDFDLFYTTIDNHSQKLSQQSFIDLYNQGDAYRKNAPAMVCPKCRTCIAQVELIDFERTSQLHHVKVEVAGSTPLIFATSRPELMMACIAVSVHPDDKRYRSYIGKKALIPGSNARVPIIADDLTKMEFGTGVVYWCPYGDITDVEFVDKHPELKVKHIMNPDGKLNKLAGKYEGMKTIEARQEVVNDWHKVGAIVKSESRLQVVNAHERCNTPIEWIVMDQWFIRMLEYQETWLDAGNILNWHPNFMKNRYDNWVKGLRHDWNISRQVPYGIPFPIWYCRKCNDIITADKKDLPVDPMVDIPPIQSCKCGSTNFIPEEDVMNTWATSALTPQIAASLVPNRYNDIYPMSLRPQAHDIISFWLFNTVVKSQLHNKINPWKDCIISGWALDPKGKKMSKSKGNVVEPQTVIQKYSADAIRFWCAGTKLGDDIPYQEKDIITGQKIITKLWNASKFTLMHLTDYDKSIPTNMEILDQWFLLKLDNLVKECTVSFNNYEFSKSKQATEIFFWHIFCDNYLEIVKDRIYNPDKRGVNSRKSAQKTLYIGLSTILKLFAPILPFITEEIYQLQRFEEKESIHLTNWPEIWEIEHNNELEKLGDFILKIISDVRKNKNENKLALNDPIKKVVIKGNFSKELFEKVIPDLGAVTQAEIIQFFVEKENKIDITC